MEEDDFLISACKRKSLNMSTMVFNSVFGFLFILFGIIHYDSSKLPYIIMGALSIVYALVGLELFKTSYSIVISKSTISIIRSFQHDITIHLEKVKEFVIQNNILQVHYLDYVKTYDLAWLSHDDFQKLSNKLIVLNIELSINSQYEPIK